MLGRNAWPGTATGDGLPLTGGGMLVVATGSPTVTDASRSSRRKRSPCTGTSPRGSPRNVWPGTVREITTAGSRLRVLITSEQAPDLVAEITPQAAPELGLADGTPVWTSVKATEPTVVAL